MLSASIFHKGEAATLKGCALPAPQPLPGSTRMGRRCTPCSLPRARRGRTGHGLTTHSPAGRRCTLHNENDSPEATPDTDVRGAEPRPPAASSTQEAPTWYQGKGSYLGIGDPGSRLSSNARLPHTTLACPLRGSSRLEPRFPPWGSHPGETNISTLPLVDRVSSAEHTTWRPRLSLISFSSTVN